MSKILLVDTSKYSRYSEYVPLALLKLSTKHKQNGDTVELVKAGSLPSMRDVDKIYFSTIFLFDSKSDVSAISSYRKKFPSAKIEVGGIASTFMYDFYRKYLPSDVEIVKGLVPELDTYPPDYDLAQLDFSYGFTSRGCPNKCEWCVVPKIEGRHFIIEDWKKAIDIKRKVFKGMDNNFLAMGSPHVEAVLKYCHDNGIKIDMNQGMDCEILMRNEKIQAVFKKYKDVWDTIRFAYDSDRVGELVMGTIDFLEQNSIYGDKGSVWYMLYDFNDGPEVIFNRLKKMMGHTYKTNIKLMRYKDLKTGGLLRKWGSIGDDWQTWVTGSEVTGIVSKNTINSWLLEGDYSSFKDKLNKLVVRFKQGGQEQIKNLRKELKKVTLLLK